MAIKYIKRSISLNRCKQVNSCLIKLSNRQIIEGKRKNKKERRKKLKEREERREEKKKKKGSEGRKEGSLVLTMKL